MSAPIGHAVRSQQRTHPQIACDAAALPDLPLRRRPPEVLLSAAIRRTELSVDDCLLPYRLPMDETPASDRVWVEERQRWYPAVLETWNTRNGVQRYWVSYAVPVNGWPGGWYERVLALAEDEDPNGEGKTWLTRVEDARLE